MSETNTNVNTVDNNPIASDTVDESGDAAVKSPDAVVDADAVDESGDAPC